MTDVVGMASEVFLVAQILAEHEIPTGPEELGRLLKTQVCVSDVIEHVDHDDEVEACRREMRFLDRMVVDLNPARGVRLGEPPPAEGGV